jgi:hypothetical protein
MKFYEVWSPDFGEERTDALAVGAVSPCFAAEEWAEVTDREGDYVIANGKSPCVVCVAEKGTTIAPVEYIVWGEIETRYTAQRKVTATY